MDGNLYPCLQEGDVDLLLGNSVEHKQGIRAVVSYDSQPYYTLTNVGNQEVLDGLNMAMAKSRIPILILRQNATPPIF